MRREREKAPFMPFYSGTEMLYLRYVVESIKDHRSDFADVCHPHLSTQALSADATLSRANYGTMSNGRAMKRRQI